MRSEKHKFSKFPMSISWQTLLWIQLSNWNFIIPNIMYVYVKNSSKGKNEGPEVTLVAFTMNSWEPDLDQEPLEAHSS